MSADPNRILIVEDDSGLTELLRESLQRVGLQVDAVGTGQECLSRPVGNSVDLLLIDYSLPDMTGAALIEELRRTGALPPFVVITGHGDEELAVRLMKLGALNYLVKDVRLLDRLPGVVVKALKEVATGRRLEAAELALRESERYYRLLFDSNPLPMWVYDRETLAFLAANKAATVHYGYTRDEFLAMTVKDIRPAEDVPKLLATVAKAAKGVSHSGDWRHRKKDGTVIDVEITSDSMSFAGRGARLVLALDITERKQAEQALRARNDELSRFNRIVTGRELRMIELKREVNDLCRQLGRPPCYPLDFTPPPPASPPSVTVAKPKGDTHE